MRPGAWLPACTAAFLLPLAAGAPHAAAPAAPDTVLARAGPRVISQRAFGEAFLRASPGATLDTLTPQARREFLQLLIDKELLAQAALKADPPLTDTQRAELRTLRDRLMLRALLDSLGAPYQDRARRAADGEGPPDSASTAITGEAARRLRDSTLARVGASYDPEVLGRLVPAFRALPPDSPDSSWAVRLKMMSTTPVVAPEDTARVVTAAGGDTVRVADLLRHWRRISPFQRPRIATREQLQAVAANVVFERWLRRLAETLRMDQRPAIREALAERREYFVVSRYVDREVWAKIPQDSATLRRFFDRHAAEWIVPAHVRALRLTATDGTQAESLAQVLRDPARAESLLAQSTRARLNLVWTVAVNEDSARYAQLQAAGVGAVVGPMVQDGGLAVARVLAVVAPRPRGFDEVRGLVLKAWTDREGERRMRSLLAGLRRRSPTWVRADLR